MHQGYWVSEKEFTEPTSLYAAVRLHRAGEHCNWTRPEIHVLQISAARRGCRSATRTGRKPPEVFRSPRQGHGMSPRRRHNGWDDTIEFR